MKSELTCEWAYLIIDNNSSCSKQLAMENNFGPCQCLDVILLMIIDITDNDDNDIDAAGDDGDNN